MESWWWLSGNGHTPVLYSFGFETSTPTTGKTQGLGTVFLGLQIYNIFIIGISILLSLHSNIRGKTQGDTTSAFLRTCHPQATAKKVSQLLVWVLICKF